MKVRIEGLTEDQIVYASAELDEEGFQYDVDYTTLYGPRGVIVGLEFTNPAAAVAVLAFFGASAYSHS